MEPIAIQVVEKALEESDAAAGSLVELLHSLWEMKTLKSQSLLRWCGERSAALGRAVCVSVRVFCGVLKGWGGCSVSQFAERISDIAIDAPHAPRIFAMVLSRFCDDSALKLDDLSEMFRPLAWGEKEKVIVEFLVRRHDKVRGAAAAVLRLGSHPV